MVEELAEAPGPGHQGPGGPGEIWTWLLNMMRRLGEMKTGVRVNL